MTIVSVAAGNPQFSILVSALQFVDTALPGSNLVQALSNDDASLTVFAPTNAAFGTLATDLGFEGDAADAGAVTAFLVEAVPAETLRDVLLYHVSAGAKDSGAVVAAGTITTLQGSSFTLDGLSLVDNEPDLANPTLVTLDIDAGNGIIHVIDRILLPIDLPGNSPEPEPEPLPTIAGIVAASGEGFDDNSADFDILLKAVQTAGLVDALNDETASLTAFAPTDAAFVTLAQTLGYESSDETGAWTYLVDALTLIGGGDPVPLLTTILTYHVAGENLDAAAVLGSTEISTLAGASFGVDGTSLVDADPDVANPNIVATDIAAANGTVHVIDGVLLPADVLQSDGSNDVDLVIGDDTREFIWTGADADLVNGKGGDDRIYAGSGDDFVLGGSGNDKVSAGSGDDTVDGGSGHDRVYGGRGDDDLNGGSGNDYVSGSRGDDTIDGGDGHDYVSGGSGNDVITGGAGHDKLYGGWGRDVFVFNEGDGHDQVRDFWNGYDKIDVSDFGFADYSELRENIHTGWSSSSIELGDGDSLSVRGLTWWNVSESDFII